jgi:DNA polymerase III subunit delta
VAKIDVPQLSLVLGDEEFLVSRALEDLRAAVRAQDPDAELYECAASAVEELELRQLLSPSLFGGRRHIVLRSAQDLSADLTKSLLPALLSPEADTSVVIQHLGAVKGKAVLAAARKAGAEEFACAKVTRLDERQQFVRNEVRRLGGTLSAGAGTALLDAVGSDLRELSAAIAQLIGDNGAAVDEAAVAAYHRGRAEVSGFAVADLVVVGNVGAALTSLRWALNSGVPPVVLADAFADGVRSIARAVGAGPGDPFTLAPQLGMAPWKLKRARTQSRGWTEKGLTQALAVTAALNADVKGAAADPIYALEASVRAVAAARST